MAGALVAGPLPWSLARSLGRWPAALVNQRVFDLEDQLASEHVEGLVEVVRVQRGTGAVRRDQISVTDTWPPVSSLRSRTLVRRFGTDGTG